MPPKIEREPVRETRTRAEFSVSQNTLIEPNAIAVRISDLFGFDFEGLVASEVLELRKRSPLEGVTISVGMIPTLGAFEARYESESLQARVTRFKPARKPFDTGRFVVYDIEGYSSEGTRIGILVEYFTDREPQYRFKDSEKTMPMADVTPERQREVAQILGLPVPAEQAA